MSTIAYWDNPEVSAVNTIYAGVTRRTVATKFDLGDDPNAPDETVEVPEDLTGVEDAELADLGETVRAEFETLYGDGTGHSAEDLDRLAALVDTAEAIREEQASRASAAAERETAAADLASRMSSSTETDGETDNEDEDEGGEDEADEDESADGAGDDEAASTVTASAHPTPRRAPVRLARRQASASLRKSTSRSYVQVASGVPGHDAGATDWVGAANAVIKRLNSYSSLPFASAHKAGHRLSERQSALLLPRYSASGLTASGTDAVADDDILRQAADESRLPGKSLVAAGGWCAPSEIDYTLGPELESHDGLYTMPEVSISRGGIQFTTAADWGELVSTPGHFRYTEAQDIAGTYGVDANGIGDGSAGEKPCFAVGCPDWQDVRLETYGYCVTSGLLQARGYPEQMARFLRGLAIANDHRQSAYAISKVIAGSTPVVFPGPYAGTVAPLLSAIELQVEHYRSSHVMPRSTTLEAVFPVWVHGVVRADLAQRLGVELLSVTDAQIDAWFRLRGIAPQFVYTWQNLASADAGTTLEWPQTVSFLLYAAGTWARGIDDVIRIDTMYDSVMLAENNFLGLFVEWADLYAKRGTDSRIISVPLCVNGATAAGIEIACNSTVPTVGP